MAGMVNAVGTIQSGSRFQPSSGTGYYETNTTFTFAELQVQASLLNVTGLPAGTDVFDLTNGVLIAIDTTNFTRPNTNTNTVLKIGDFVYFPVDIINMSGNFTDMTICLNNSAPMNFTINMSDLGGYCNYKSSWASKITFPRSLTSVTSCFLTIETNSTTGIVCLNINEDTTLDDTNLAGIIGSAAVTITSIVVLYAWTSKVE